MDDKIENNELKIQKLKVLLTSFFIKISLNKNKVCIVSLISEIKERLGKKELPAYSVINTGELISQDLYFDKRVHSKDMCKYKLIKQYDFAYNPSRINIGSIAMFEHLEGAVSPIYVAFKPKDEYKYYINEFVKTEQFNKEINLRANGSVRQSVNYDIFAEVQIPVPMLDELNGFNKTYQEISNKIKKLKQVNHKLSKLKNHYLRKFFG